MPDAVLQRFREPFLLQTPSKTGRPRAASRGSSLESLPMILDPFSSDTPQWETWVELCVTKCLNGDELPPPLFQCASLGESYFTVRKVLFPLAFALTVDREPENPLFRAVLQSKNVPVHVLRQFIAVVEVLETTGMAIPLAGFQIFE
jgi:hypothetical protein